MTAGTSGRKTASGRKRTTIEPSTTSRESSPRQCKPGGMVPSIWWAAGCVAVAAVAAAGSSLHKATPGGQQRSDAMVEEWKRFSNWLRSQGATVHPALKLAYVNHGGAEIRGVVSQVALKKGTLLARLPAHVLLTEGSAPEVVDYDLGALGLDGCYGEIAEEVKLAATVALEMQKDKVGHKVGSNWQPYLDLLPSWEDIRSHHPDLGEQSVIDDFRDLHKWQLRRTISDKKNTMFKRCFEQWKSLPDSPVADLSNDQVLYAAYLARTRVFDVHTASGSSWTSNTLLPLVDSFNTALFEKYNVQWHFKGSDLDVKTQRDIKAGEELLLCYCPNCDNEALMSHWGVYFEDNDRAVSNFEKVNCSSALRHAAEQELDLTSLDVALKEGLTAPRCVSQEESQRDQSGLRCNLARLSWETCAPTWGYEDWNRSGKKTDPEARRKAASARYNLALSQKRLGDLDGARENYKASLKLRPEAGEVHYGLGLLLQQMDRHKEAKSSFQAALKLGPLYADANLALAQVFYELGDMKKAHKHREEGVRLRAAGQRR